MISLTPYLLAIENEEDRAFFERLYEVYSSDMKLYARSLVGDRFAEDALHNAFLKLINKIELLKDLCPEQRRTYILMTIRSCAYDILRMEQKYTDIEEYEQFLSEDAPTVVDKIIDREGYEYLKTCIRKMSDNYREVCELKYVLHMKEREIAQELGLSEKNVNARIFRGKQVLRKMIKEMYSHDQ